MACARPSAATRLSLHPATTWIFRKTRSFPSPAHTEFGFCGKLPRRPYTAHEFPSRRKGTKKSPKCDAHVTKRTFKATRRCEWSYQHHSRRRRATKENGRVPIEITTGGSI